MYLTGTSFRWTNGKNGRELSEPSTRGGPHGAPSRDPRESFNDHQVVHVDASVDLSIHDQQKELRSHVHEVRQAITSPSFSHAHILTSLLSPDVFPPILMHDVE